MAGTASDPRGVKRLLAERASMTSDFRSKSSGPAPSDKRLLAPVDGDLLQGRRYDLATKLQGRGMGYSRRPRRKGFWTDKVAGKRGYVYILENPGLRAGFIKIGATTRSGAIRAAELNEDAGTGTPGAYTCVFEFGCLDCGAAEKRVHREFAKERRHQKRGQEFFEVDRSRAIAAILRACAEIDEELAPPREELPPAPEPPRADSRRPIAPPVREPSGQGVVGNVRQATAGASSAVSQRTSAKSLDEAEVSGTAYRVLVLIVVALFVWMVTSLPAERPVGSQLLTLAAERPALWAGGALAVVLLVCAMRFFLAGRDQTPMDRRRWLGPEPMVRYRARLSKDDLARSIRDDSVRPLRRSHPHRPVSPPIPAKPPERPTSGQAAHLQADRSAYWRQLGGTMTGRRDVCRRCDSETAIVTVGSTVLCSVCGTPTVR